MLKRTALPFYVIRMLLILVIIVPAVGALQNTARAAAVVRYVVLDVFWGANNGTS